MKLMVDYDLCEANGMCVMEAPDVFELDDDDQLHVTLENVDEAHREAVENAICRCPRGALSLEA